MGEKKNYGHSSARSSDVNAASGRRSPSQTARHNPPPPQNQIGIEWNGIASTAPVSASSPLVGFGELNDNNIKDLTSLRSVEQEIEFIT
jgi:hypothetical protein